MLRLLIDIIEKLNFKVLEDVCVYVEERRGSYILSLYGAESFLRVSSRNRRERINFRFKPLEINFKNFSGAEIPKCKQQTSLFNSPSV